MSNLNVAFRGDTSHLNSSIKGVRRGIKGLGAALKTAFLPLAAIGAAVGGIGVAFKGINLAAELETVHVKFETILGDTEKATELLGNLRETAKSTPYEFDQITKAADQLIVKFGGGDDMIKRLREIGDVASGSGNDIAELAKIYAQVGSTNRVDQEKVNQLAERGIPIYKELAKVMGVQETELKKVISSGKIGFAELEQVFKNLTKEGGTFFQSMEKQSLTWNGLVSTLKSNIDDMLASFAAPIISELKFFLEKAISLSAILTEYATKAGEAVANIIRNLREGYEAGNLKETLWATLEWVGLEFGELLGNVMGYAAQQMIDILAEKGVPFVKGSDEMGVAVTYAGGIPVVHRTPARGKKEFKEFNTDLGAAEAKEKAFSIYKKNDDINSSNRWDREIGFRSPEPWDANSLSTAMAKAKAKEQSDLKQPLETNSQALEKNTQAISTDNKSKTVEEKPKWGFGGQNLTNLLPELARIGGARGISSRFQNNIRAKMLEETKKQTKVNEETRDAVRDLKTINMGGAVLG